MRDMALRNWEIVMVALQLEGAASRRIHTEDVTLRCFKLAADAFSWLKHPEYPDKEVVRKDLIRLRSGQYGGVFAQGRAGLTRREENGAACTDGWQLTDDGIKWLLENHDRLHGQLDQRLTKTNRQEDLKSLQRVRRHALFVSYEDDPNNFAPTLGELAEMLRCRVDSDDAIWSTRFNSLRNQAKLSGQIAISEFLELCETVRPKLS